MSRYTKKPVTIEAVQFLGSAVHGGTPIFGNNEPSEPGDGGRAPTWLTKALAKEPHEPGSIKANVNGGLFVMTLEGVHVASPGDWIIQGVKGELYPIKPDIFEATYAPAED